jgi:hypothetical protein
MVNLFLLSIDQNYFLILKKTILIWREVVKKAGFPDLYIGFAETNEYFRE